MDQSIGSKFNVLLVGAGNVMFGSNEGPWDHSLRLERKLGSRLRVVAVVDPAIDRARAAIHKKATSDVASAYHDTRIFNTLHEFATNMAAVDRPQAIIVGSPPMFRGTLQANKDIEVQILKLFPSVAIFVEKPVTTGPQSEIDDLRQLANSIADAKIVSSVGYMLRYLNAIQMMKKILKDNNLTVMCTIARYTCAYEAIAKPDWWDKSKSAGPIIEQGTHFCDLSRYFGGEVDLSTVSAHSLEWDESAGHLSKIPIDESILAPENRIPRVTAATWKYSSGAVGSLTHLVSLQGTNYSCELEVHADGYALKLVDLYVHPTLYVRKPGDDKEQSFTFTDDDPFFSEISHFINAVENPLEASQILSSYEDACKSYELTWAIREASEKSRQKRSACAK